MVAADVDGDGDMDVLSASIWDGKIAWYQNTDGKGTFGPQQVVAAGVDDAPWSWCMMSVYTADVDGDGHHDLLDATRADTDPKVYTSIHMHFVVKGRGVDPAKVARAVNLSVEKYCSASIMLGATAELTHDYEIRDV